MMTFKIFLTFDVEDYLSANKIEAFRRVLARMEHYGLKGLFFITGYVAEKLVDYPDIVELLKKHEVGYHSSSHSVHPAVYEFTDVKDFDDAVSESVARETCHVNPFSGELEGTGGLYALWKIFPWKEIVAYRAPWHCWTPSHLEALKSLGVRFDFSTTLSKTPVSFKGLTFYPYPLSNNYSGKPNYRYLALALRNGCAVLTVHPSMLVNSDPWDSNYLGANPTEAFKQTPRSLAESELLFREFENLLKLLKRFIKVGAAEITPNLKETDKKLSLNFNIDSIYNTSMRWAKKQGYNPKFLSEQFCAYFCNENQDSIGVKK